FRRVLLRSTFSYVALSIPSDLRRCSCPLPCFPWMISVAIWLMDFLGLGFGFGVLPPSLVFTSARTFSYSDLEIPRDLRLTSCPVPCLPAMTSSAICDMVFPSFFGLLDGFLAG